MKFYRVPLIDMNSVPTTNGGWITMFLTFGAIVLNAALIIIDIIGMLTVLAVEGIRCLYRRHKGLPAEPLDLDPDLSPFLESKDIPPQPYMSPVENREYPGNDWS